MSPQLKSFFFHRHIYSLWRRLRLCHPVGLRSNAAADLVYIYIYSAEWYNYGTTGERNITGTRKVRNMHTRFKNQYPQFQGRPAHYISRSLPLCRYITCPNLTTNLDYYILSRYVVVESIQKMFPCHWWAMEASTFRNHAAYIVRRRKHPDLKIKKMKTNLLAYWLCRKQSNLDLHTLLFMYFGFTYWFFFNVLI